MLSKFLAFTDETYEPFSTPYVCAYKSKITACIHSAHNVTIWPLISPRHIPASKARVSKTVSDFARHLIF